MTDDKSRKKFFCSELGHFRIFDIAFESKIFEKSPFCGFRENGESYGRSDCLKPSKHPHKQRRSSLFLAKMQSSMSYGRFSEKTTKKFWGYPPGFLGVRFGYLDPIFIWTSYTRFAQKHLISKLKIRGRPQKCKVFEYGPRRILGLGSKMGVPTWVLGWSS